MTILHVCLNRRDTPEAPAWCHWLVLIASVVVLLGQLVGGSVHAQTPTYKPLLSREGGNVKPNMVFNLDTSGSMAYRYMPESAFQVGSYTVTFPTDRSMAIHPAEFMEFNNGYFAPPTFTSLYSGIAWGDPSNTTNVLQRQMRSPDVNSIYYNPEIRYLPWVLADGTRMPNASPTAARLNPVNFGVTATVSLTVTSQTYALTTTNVYMKGWVSDITGGVMTVETGTGTAATKRFAPGLYYRLQTTTVSGLVTYRDPNVASNYTAYNINTMTSFPRHPNRVDCIASTTSCNQAEERQNFANWFVYYRSRMLLAQGAIPEAFVGIGDKLRFGWGTIHKGWTVVDGTNTASVIQGVRDFTTTHKTSFFDWIRRHPLYSGTPLRQAMYGVGEYYSRSDDRGPWSETPGTVSTEAHKTCRRAYHMMVTDGYWSNGTIGLSAGTTVTLSLSIVPIGNSDNVDGPLHSGPGRDSTKYTRARPYRDSNATTTLADVAMHYWKRDLRGTTTGSPSLDNKVQPTADNPAFWQHMVNYTVGLGVRGLLNPNTDLPRLASGEIDWTEDKIDDLWHAAVNSRGSYFSARNPAELTEALRLALTQAAERELLEAGVATSSQTLEAGNRKYIPRYKTAVWTGDVEAYLLDENGLAGAKVWGAKDKLPAWGSRNIVTWDSGLATPAGVTFTWANLSASSRAALTATAGTITSATLLVDYLRGDRSNEAADRLRVRESVLGDVINSNPVFVKDSFDSGHANLPIIGSTYATYVNNVKKTRNGVVYVGGNDGMLHGFVDSKSPTSPNSDGAEIFAYVPRAVYSSLPLLASRTYGTTDNYHRFFVDGYIREVDAHIPSTAGGTATWRNLLVGSTGLGGRAVFAIDVTDPNALRPSSIRWEISSANDSDLGYVLSPVQTGVLKNGSWVAVFGNGYGGSSGKGFLFVVDLFSGAIQKLPVDLLPTSGNGLGGVSLVRDSDGYIQYLYAGDLKGNLWKFEYDASAASKFKIAFSGKALATATDSSGTAQPIIQPPALFNHSAGGKIVVFATGRLITDADADTSNTQSMYGVRDLDSQTGPSPSIALPYPRSSLEPRSITSFIGTGGASGQTFFDITGDTVNWDTKRGWVIDLTISGYTGLRVIYPPQAADSRNVLISSIAPAQNLVACESATGRGANFLFPVETGLSALVPTYDTNGDGVIDEVLSSDPTSGDRRGAGFAGNADGVDSILWSATGNRLSIQNTTGQMGARLEPPAAPSSGATPRDRVWRRIMNPPIQ